MSANAIGTDAVADEQRSRLQRALGDGYEVRGQIGRGGFATVYAAFDKQLKREVAVKVLRAELEAPVFRDRFRREAEAVAQLRHPHIVPIYAVGEAEGLAWLIMPHIRGESLQQRIEREGKLPIDDATRILRDAASALAAAHRSGILHRDIKPDNIMLDGDEGHVLLMDFGIAKALGGGDSGVTATGMIVGTPQYMSPEQATGDKAIDARSDIYSLGVVGFHIIAGTPPFSAASVPMLIMKHIAEAPPSLLDVRRDCPRSLADAIARCLEKDPASRWSNAEELGRALSSQMPGILAPGIRRISHRVSGAVAEPGVAKPVRDFRVGIVIAVAALALGIVADVMLGKMAISPVVLLVSAIALASKYGQLWTEGYDWRQIINPSSQPASPGGAEAADGRNGAAATPRSLEMRRLGGHGPRVHRARLDRGAIIGILAQLPRSEREKMPDVLTHLDTLLAEATSLAAQLTALDSGSSSGATKHFHRTASGRSDTSSGNSAQDKQLAEVRAKLEVERAGNRERLEQRLEECFSSIDAIRLAVERIEAEGWTAGEPLLRQLL